jgi:hypothetical protein
MTGAENSTRTRDGPDAFERSDPGLLPRWWTDAIEEFREYDLRPYRPPQFDDGVVVPPLVERLETELGVEIRLMGVDVRYGDAWGVYVDGDVVTTVDRERTRAGFTRYELTSTAFEDAVRAFVAGDAGAVDDSTRSQPSGTPR